MEAAIELENMQIEIATEDYYESEQFYKEIEEARQQVKNGQCKEINSKEDLNKLIFG